MGEQIRLVSENGIEALVSTLGAELQSLKDSTGKEFIWGADPAVWPRHAPILFPFVGRVFSGEYRYNGKTYKMRQHGFLRDMEGTVDERGPDRLRLSFCSDDLTREIYPFDFKVVVSYHLHGNTLDIGYHVANENGFPLVFGLGSHPGFSLPLDEGLEVSDYKVSFPLAEEARRFTARASNFLTGEDIPYDFKEGNSVPLSFELFDSGTTILKNMGPKAVLSSDRGTRRIELDFPDTPYCAIWSLESAHANYVCIEPWFTLPGWDGVVEDLEVTDHLLRVGPFGKWGGNLSITIN